MKFTVVFVTLLSISWGLKVSQEDSKDKREAPVGYHSGGHPSPSFHTPASYGHGDASAVSIGAGYSVGGAKPSYAFAAPEENQGYQISSESLPASGHATIQLAPLTLQQSHGGGLVSGDLSQLMHELTQGLNSGSLTLSPSSYQSEGQSAHGGQEYAAPQHSFGELQLQQYSSGEQAEGHGPSMPSYALGTKGLGSFGSTGPVLFTPSDSQTHQATLTYGAPGAGHSFGDAGTLSFGSGNSLAGLSLGDSGHSFASAGHSLGGHSLGGQSLGGHSLGGQSLGGHSLGGHALGGHALGGHALGGHALGGHSLGGHSLGGHSLGASGYSLGGSGHSLGGSGHSLGGSGHSLGGSGHSFGGSGHSFGGSIKNLAAKTSFKPSTYLGSHGDSGHGYASLSSSHGAPSFGSHSLSGGHGGLSLSSGGHGHSFGSPHGSFGGGSSKFLAQSYLPPKSKGFGASHDSLAAFSSSSHASPPRTTYGVPTASYSGGPATSSHTHSASSHSPQFYVSSSKFPSFGEGSSSFKGASSGHGSLSSFSSGGPKFGFSSQSSPSSHYGAPKDIQGSYSENSYNTIKYSEELKSHAR